MDYSHFDRYEVCYLAYCLGISSLNVDLIYMMVQGILTKTLSLELKTSTGGIYTTISYSSGRPRVGFYVTLPSPSRAIT